ncbi:MAG: amino acid ABC transporter permease [Actinobacteria bacterium]|nr:amino acid ABC transporter permease [Actinomycetota bacterium]
MITWLRRNLFRTWWDSIMTVVFGYVGLWVIWTVIEFVFVTGRWEIIQVNLKLLLVGRFPDELMWLVGASLTALAFWVAAVAGGSKIDLNNVQTIPQRLFDYARRFGLILALAALLIFLAADIAALLLAFQVLGGVVAGRLVGLARRNVRVLGAIPSIIWHPMLASPAIIISIVLCFPLGVLLALGRRSSFPIIRLVTTTYIELIRGAPLFVLLLLAGVALEFFIPPSIAPDAIFRGVTVFTLFTAAYLAEIVRGGLQSIPKGQTEAGKALGLSTTKITYLITMPQALRNVIPAQIGQFISLFKDTTLAGAALNILDVLNVGTAITKQQDFLGQGLIYEALAFVALLFWVGSYVMSRESQRLEKRLGVGVR